MTTNNSMIDTLKHAWDLLSTGDFDALAALYTEDMAFVLPGQNDILKDRSAFRSALDNIGAALPVGFEINRLRYFVGDSEVMNVVEWKSEKIPNGTQSAILWKFDAAGKITEERWYVDTEQWKDALA